MLKFQTVMCPCPLWATLEITKRGNPVLYWLETVTYKEKNISLRIKFLQQIYVDNVPIGRQLLEDTELRNKFC